MKHTHLLPLQTVIATLKKDLPMPKQYQAINILEIKLPKYF